MQFKQVIAVHCVNHIEDVYALLKHVTQSCFGVYSINLRSNIILIFPSVFHIQENSQLKC